MGVVNNIPESWVETNLGDVCEIKYGKDHKKLNDGNIPCFGSGGLMRRVSEILYDKPSVLIPRKGTLTNLFFIDEPFWTVDTLFYTKINSSKILPKYLFYKLKTYDLESLNVGSAVPSLTTAVLNQFPFTIPNIPEQKAIANVLTAFDDKIELLQAQNKTLETMAQTIFKEWFGKYQMGDELPEGWRFGKLGEIANLKSGYAFKSKDFVEESSKKALKIKDLKGDGKVSLNAVSCVSNDVTKLNRVQYFRLKEGDIILAMSGNTTGKIGVIPPHSNEVYLNQRVGKFFMIKKNLNSFLYSFLMSGNYEEKILSMGYGSAQPNVNPSQIENIDIIYPNEEKLFSFLNISNPIFNKVLYNNNQIQSLAKTRDTLLPKLMSGQVRVNNIKQTTDA